MKSEECNNFSQLRENWENLAPFVDYKFLAYQFGLLVPLDTSFSLDSDETLKFWQKTTKKVNNSNKIWILFLTKRRCYVFDILSYLIICFISN